jgi:hypothetical protein
MLLNRLFFCHPFKETLLMKHLAVLALALTPLAGLAADLTIPAGKTYVVGIDQQELVLENLHIGDGAKITFAPAVGDWRVQARHAFIGKGVVIDGNGVGGEAGTTSSAGAKCSDGIAGGDGGDGGDGVAIRLQLGLESLGDLYVLANGGAGGSGGAGGDGADVNEDCDGVPAGEGGNGGDGGQGGRGGDVTILYQVLSKVSRGDDIAARIKIDNQGAAGGDGGDAGSGGVGTGGYYINRKTLAGGRKWVEGGDGGLAGSPGSAGSAGNPGRILVDQLILSSAQAVDVKSPATTLLELQRQIERLRARVDKLEAAATAQ